MGALKRSTPVTLLVAVICACSGASQQRPASSGTEAPAEAPDTAAEPAPPSGPRMLAPDATFADLVEAANTLDANGEGDSDSPCALRPPRREGWPWELQADLSAAVRPLPEAPEDLDDRLRSSPAPVLAVTRWGQLGARNFELALASFFNAPPLLDLSAAVLIMTSRGVYLRYTDLRVSTGRTEAVPLDLAVEQLEERLEEGQMIYVTAEAQVSVADLVELLDDLPTEAPVSLAVALGESIRVPDPPAPPVDRGTGLCPDGLPSLGEGVTRGGLDATLVLGALRPLRLAVQSCMEDAAGTRAPGGRVEVMMRIDPQGQVDDACLLSDEVGGTELRSCLIEAASGTRFPHPSPSGYVDVALPLRLQPTYQRPLCDE